MKLTKEEKKYLYELLADNAPCFQTDDKRLNAINRIFLKLRMEIYGY